MINYISNNAKLLNDFILSKNKYKICVTHDFSVLYNNPQPLPNEINNLDLDKKKKILIYLFVKLEKQKR